MLIVCPSCATSYDIEPASLRPNGRKVRCVRCRTIWRAEPSQAEKLVAAAEALAPEGELHLADRPSRFPGANAAPALAPTEPVTDPARVDQLREAEAFPSFDAGQDEPEAERVALNSAAEPANAPDIEAPPIAPVDFDAGRPPIDIDADYGAEAAGAPQTDLETYAARLSRRGGKRQPQPWSFTWVQAAILAFIMVDAIIVGWRKDIVRILPQTASFYALMGLSVNIRGLAFDAVTTTTEQHDGVLILVVQGSIVNQTAAVADVPRLKLALRNAAKQEVYSWTAVPPRATLTPYQAVAFRTRLASPPPDGADVLVRFVNRRDIVAEPR